jgi:hypothetical protein
MTENKTAGAPEPRVAFGRALVDFRIEGATTPHGLLPAEEKLVAAAARGEWCTVSGLDWTKEGDLKKLKKDEQYHVRPEVLRCLALGADAAAPVHEKGIQILGAFIPGDLDLEDAELCRPLWLQQSYFDGSVILRNARMSTLSIGGSRIAGLEGDRTIIVGGVYLRNGFKADGEVRLIGASVDGNLDCSSASFHDEDGKALTCEVQKLRAAYSSAMALRPMGGTPPRRTNRR